MHELILGGARSGKSACAEGRARQWLAGGGEATLIATALAADAEMMERIARHRAERAQRAPGLRTHEEPVDLGGALRRLGRPGQLLVVDCLTLWLSQALLPPPGHAPLELPRLQAELLDALDALRALGVPVLLVSNEIGCGVMPMGREVRACVDALGALHKAVAARCDRLTLMVAGYELRVK